MSQACSNRCGGLHAGGILMKGLDGGPRPHLWVIVGLPLPLSLVFFTILLPLCFAIAFIFMFLINSCQFLVEIGGLVLVDALNVPCLY